MSRHESRRRRHHQGEHHADPQISAEYLMPAEIDSVDALKLGEGGIVRNGMSKVAASRDEKGKLHLVSAVCTHLGCHVHWNSTQQRWTARATARISRRTARCSTAPPSLRSRPSEWL